MNKKIIIIPNPYYLGRFFRFNNLYKFTQSYNKYMRKKNYFTLPEYKRTNILFHHSIHRLHSQFSDIIQKKFIYKNNKFYFLFSKFINKHLLKLIITAIILTSPFLIYRFYSEEINTTLDDGIKYIVINKVCKNEFIIKKISWEILVLCKKDSIKHLLSNLIINDVLPNKEIRNDLYRIIKREIIIYLKSEDCRRELKSLIIKEVMRNEEIKNDLYSLIKQFITLKEIDFLEDKLEKILVDILSIEAIHTHVGKKVEEETHKALRDENLIRMAVNILSEKFSK
jgi:hypothetical protein